MTGQDWTVCQANEMSLMLMLEAGPSRTLCSLGCEAFCLWPVCVPQAP